ncbi:MAG: hypothetical protein WDO13_19375 [Verrucomicrobiota bacterium]
MPGTTIPPRGGFRRITLVEQGTSDAVRGGEIARRLEAALEKFCPAAVVVPGWASPAHGRRCAGVRAAAWP